jgi:hypothetical protein
MQPGTGWKWMLVITALLGMAAAVYLPGSNGVQAAQSAVNATSMDAVNDSYPKPSPFTVPVPAPTIHRRPKTVSPNQHPMNAD